MRKTPQSKTVGSPAQAQQEPRAGRAKPPGSPRRIWYRLLVLFGLPAFLLLCGEGLLRLAGYGYSTDFFRQTQIRGGANLAENPDFGRRFFPPGLVRCSQPFIIPAVKPPGTLRIFVLGESAAMGDPDFKFGLPRMVEVLLRERFPDRKFEVVSAAMVAINSHVVLPIGEDCAKRQGDLWIVYLGNNEMIGPFGCASVFGARAPALSFVRIGLWVKTTRFGQLFDAGLYFARRRNQPLPEWAGMEMMVDQRIQYDSAATERVYAHFEQNLVDLLETGLQAHVPIVLCTVATNLRDCAPFASLHRSGLTPTALADWEKAYSSGIVAQDRGQWKEALTNYDQAVAIDSGFADLAFRRGECFRLLGQGPEAEKCFHQARNEDALQFRADDRINDTVRRSAKAFAGRQVRLVDAENLFATNSLLGIPGAEYFYEHVHLTPEGNYLLARAVAEQAAEALALKASGAWASLPECLKLLGFTDWNRCDALKVILDRIQSAPFTHQLDHAHQLQVIHEKLEQYRLATKPAQLRREAAQVAELVARFPKDPDLRWNLAALLENAGDTTGAEEQWRALMDLQPQAALPAFNLGRLLETRGRLSEALEFYRQSLRGSSEDRPALYGAGVLCLKLDRAPEAIEYLTAAVRQKPASVEARLALAQALLRGRKQPGAEKQLLEVLRLDPNNASARQALEEISGPRGRN